MSESDLKDLLNRAQNLLGRVNQAFHWTKRDLKELEQALISLKNGFEETLKAVDETPEIQQKQVFIFFENELRFWDTRENWNNFQKRWNLIEDFDFKLEPFGAVITDTMELSEKTHDYCGVRGEKRCIRHNWIPRFSTGGFINLSINYSFNVNATSSFINVPFIPTMDLYTDSSMTPQQLREVTGLKDSYGSLIPRSGYASPENVGIFNPSFVSVPSSYPFFPSFDPQETYCSYTIGNYKYTLPTVAVPISHFNLKSNISSITFDSFNVGGGKEVPIPPHIDLVCVRFLKFIKLS